MAFTYTNNKGVREATIVSSKAKAEIFSMPIYTRPEYQDEDGFWEETGIVRIMSNSAVAEYSASGELVSYGGDDFDEIPGGHPGFFYALQYMKRRLGLASLY